MLTSDKLNGTAHSKNKQHQTSHAQNVRKSRVVYGSSSSIEFFCYMTFVTRPRAFDHSDGHVKMKTKDVTIRENEKETVT